MPKVSLPEATGGLVTGGLVSVAARPNPAVGATFSPVRATANGTTTPELQGSDFIILEEPKPQTVGIIFAKDGEGKSFCAVNYCPEPVVLIGLDGRAERVAKEALNRGRKIYYLDASMPANVLQMSHEQAQAAGKASLDLITKNYEWAIAKSLQWGRGTIVIDTSTELRDIARVAVRGRVDRVQTKGEGDFGKSDAIINRTLWYFCKRARDSKLNLVLLSRSKPIYEGREDSGRSTFDTDKVFVAACDWIAEYRMVGVANMMTGIQVLGAPTIAGPTFEMQATKPKLAIDETGKIYRQADWEADGSGPFAYGCVRMVPGSKTEDWL